VVITPSRKFFIVLFLSRLSKSRSQLSGIGDGESYRVDLIILAVCATFSSGKLPDLEISAENLRA